MKRGTWIFVVGVCGAFAIPARAGLIVYGTQTSDPVVTGSLHDIQMDVGLNVSGGQATFTFQNVSVPPETTAVLSEVVLNTFNDTTSTDVLSGTPTLSFGPGVDLSASISNGLPGYHDPVADGHYWEFAPDSKTTLNGVGIGEYFSATFPDTTLSDGATMTDFLNALGNDGQYFTGFHAIDSTVLGGNSASGIYVPPGGPGQPGGPPPDPNDVPEPGTMILLGIALVGMGGYLRRRWFRAGKPAAS